jgi:DNA-directed RNA polymerase specialized sigma24 family protein
MHNTQRDETMPSDGSVSRLIDGLVVGDAVAIQGLWERYFRRLVGLARKKIAGAPRRSADEEDVALSAFDSFCRNAERGLFPQLLDRDSLWRLLVVITARKSAHLLRDENRLKRGGGAVMHTQTSSDEEEEPVILDEVLSREPSPEFAALAAEEHQRLLAALGEDELRSVALWRMEGYSVEEIAARLGYASRSIKRKLQLIRTIWEKEIRP